MHIFKFQSRRGATLYIWYLNDIIYSKIISIIVLLVAVSGVSVIGIWDRWKAKMDSEVKIVDDKSESQYKIYLYSEYSTFYIGMQIDMTASVNFETDAVIVTAYLASGREDTVS